VKTATDRFAEAIEAAEMMFPELLRTYALSAVVCVLLGIGIGFGWHFVDRAGGRIAASAATPPAKQDAPILHRRTRLLSERVQFSMSPGVQVYPRPNNRLEAWRSTSPMRRSSLS